MLPEIAAHRYTSSHYQLHHWKKNESDGGELILREDTLVQKLSFNGGEEDNWNADLEHRHCSSP
jgi:hypothetical protein